MKVYTVNKARASKTRRVCRCGHEVQIGETYRYVQARYGPEKDFCKDHHPRPSDMTSSDKLATLYGIREGLEDNLEAFDKGELGHEDLQSAVNDASSEAESVAEEYEASADAIEETFSSSPTADECREKADAIREWVGELESINWPDPPEEDVEEPEEPGEDADEEALAAYELALVAYEKWEQEKDDFLREVSEAVQGAVDSLEV